MSEDGLDKHGEPWEALSSLVDGEASAGEQVHCLSQWTARAGLRARWQEYHVIGDALRSEELVALPDRDAAFLGALRERLAREPAHPAAAGPQARRMPAWFGPVAVAAGVGAVALTLSVLGPLAPETGTGAAGDPRLVAASRASSAVDPVMEPKIRVVSGQLIRDARLDRYLAAHRQGAMGTSLQMPGTVVRSVDTLVLEDK